MVCCQLSRPLNVVLPEDHYVDSLDDFTDVFGPLPTQPHDDPNKLLVHDDPGLFYSPRGKLENCYLESNCRTICSIEDDDALVGIQDFEVLKFVGEGAFAKVYQVRKNGSSDIFAMKVIRKDLMVEQDHTQYVKTERDILTKVDHPFIVRLRYCFQTKYRLYLVLDFVNGGDLDFQLQQQFLFKEDLARIYAAEIVSAVSYLHANGILHRDLKPDNVLLDDKGHVMITDFGLAKQFDDYNNTRSDSICGTWKYMAPEVILGKYHDKACDWWSVGVLLYQMLTGKLPFVGGAKRWKVQDKIVNKKFKLPPFLSSDAHSLLKGLLYKDASQRLGSGPGGSEEIKGHKWFGSINWKKLEAREIQPSFVPQVTGKQCIANFEESLTNMPAIPSPAASPKCAEDTFQGFTYVCPAIA